MIQIVKRKGQIVNFDITKITEAIRKAFTASSTEYNEDVLDFLALKVTANFQPKIKNGKISVEDVQDSVESVLIQAGYENVAKAYILYRRQHEKLREMKETKLDYKKLVESYVDFNDWRVKENSTVTYSLGGLILSNSGAITANYWLSEIYDKEIGDAHRNADLHIHDLSMLSGYCFTGDTRIVTVDGRNPSFEELVANNVKSLLVYSYNSRGRRIETAMAINPRITRMTDVLTSVVLDNGTIIRCTPDHPFLLKNGIYCRAGDLRDGAELMTVNKNQSVRVALSGTETLKKGVPVYDLTVPSNSNFSIEGGVIVHNCAGWSLKQLIQEGLGGINGKISSSPAKHLATLCNQMVNFIGCLQNEWAGAQAFTSFDTYLAPFVKVDNLSYDAVKRCIESLIFGLNTPSRWGCVDTETEVLSENGFKKFNELKEGDLIYTWNNGVLELNPVRAVVIKEYEGNMHSYSARGYHQFVSPDHRVLYKEHNINRYNIRHSEEIFDVQTAYPLPVMFKSSDIGDCPITDMDIELAAAIYTDGSIDIRNGKVHKISIFKSPNRYGNEMVENAADELQLDYTVNTVLGTYGSMNKYVFYRESAEYLFNLVGGSKKAIASKFMNMTQRQADLFLKTWALFDGDETKLRLQYDNELIADQLQQIAILAGRCSYHWSNGRANYIKIRQSENVYPTSRKEVYYKGIIWCPNVENGTAVFRKDGSVFISGQCQAPFSNVTLDWTVPDDLAELNAIVGGKEMDFKYKDCKAEMDMINKAFIEIMIEGDANGRGFQYPIPTYSITRDFDWSETENNRLLFEMTAKYGTPYFSNYVNSDMSPSDTRSMCPLHGKEKVLVLDDYSKEWHVSEIQNLSLNKEYKILYHGKAKTAKINKFDQQEFYQIKLKNNHSVVLSSKHLNLTDSGVKTTDRLSEEDYLPFEAVATEGAGLDYVDGFMVGAFFGDGSLNSDYAVTYSLNSTSKKETMEYIIANSVTKYGCKYRTNDINSNCINVTITSKMLRGLIEDYVTGTSLTKQISIKAINRSVDFRKGIIDGLMATDGNKKSQRYYTSSRRGAESIITILASLGIVTAINVDDRDDTVTYSNNPVYSIGMYSAGSASYKDVFKVGDNTVWFKIQSIEKFDKNVAGYCFEVIDREEPEPYFMLPNGLITHNCRLRLDLRELRKKSGGFFGSGESTGSVGVVTINMPRIAYLATDENDFFKRLDHMMDIAARSLKIKRNLISKLFNDGLYPYTKRYLPGFDNHFSTIGLVGMNEAGLNAKWIRKDMTTEETQKFTIKVLNHMRERLSDYQEEYGDLYNLEATPAESTSYRLAKHDKEKYPDIITANGDCGNPYYTNSSHLPVGYTDDIFSALDIQDELQTLYTSGTVFHGFLGEKLPSWKSAQTLVRKIAENYRLPYYTLSPTYSVCKEHGYLAGEQFKCPICGNPTEVYSRITGYYRPVQNWNAGKSQEYKDRKTYDINIHMGKYDKETSQEENNSCASCTVPDYSIEMTEKENETLSADVILFATKTCPNCKAASAFLEKKGIPFTKVYADEHPELAQKYGIKMAPTLIVGDVLINNLSNIKKWIESR